MPANTSPDNIEYPVSTDPVAPLETVFANMASSVQDAFDGFRIDWNNFENNRAIQTFRWADATARNAQTGMVAGDVGYQVDTGVQYRYIGAVWTAWGSDWISYTPTTSGVTLGTGGSVTASYKYVLGRIFVRIKVQLGTSGAAVTGGVSFTLPATSITPAIVPLAFNGATTYLDASATTSYIGAVGSNGSSTTAARFVSANSGSLGGLSAASPFAWAASDAMYAEFVYDPA